MARSALAGKGIKMAKEGNTLGPITMTCFTPPISPTVWRMRLCRRCGPARGAD